MKLISLWRTLKESFVNFKRNGWLSLATISVVVLSLYVISFVVFIGIVGNRLILDLQDKINVSAYFDVGVKEDKIIEIKSELTKFSEIKMVDYISREQALEDFKEENADEPVVLQSLEVVGGNPFMASLVIRAKNPRDYELIAKAIEQNYGSEVSRINYGRNKEVIDKLTSVIGTVKQIGLGIGLLFVFISILITFNTIRITMYNHRQEIEVKRLVGASNWYIRSPYIFEGILYSVIASIASILFLYATVYFTTPVMSRMIPGISFKALFVQNLPELYFLGLALGVILGIISSFIAIRRYLKV